MVKGIDENRFSNKLITGISAITLYTADMKEAVVLASHAAKTGEAILLAPACNSLDQYPDYEARGQAFVQAVEELCL